jgi:PAS domain S-box-containing protein
MAQNKTQHYLRTIDVDQKIVANIDNGIIILDANLIIYHYNRWLELHTKIKESDVLGETLDKLFPEIKQKTLIRKIKTALRLKTPTFYTATTSKYLIPIRLNQIKNANFKYMQQDVSIIPFDEEKELVALILTDQTNMIYTNSLLESNIKKVQELNAELLKERKTIDEKILFVKIDKSALIVDVSEALLDLLLFEKEDLVSLNFIHFEQRHLSETLKIDILTAIEELRVFEFENKTLTQDGKIIWLKNSIVPEFDAKGNHLGFIIFRENITASKNLVINHEKMLANSRSAAMGEMIAMIAHQWRQPLSLINTVIATMKIKKELNVLSEETINQSFEKIQSTTQFLSHTIDDFREYFKPNKLTSTFTLITLFDKSIFFLKEEMIQNDIKYTLDINESIEITTYKNELLQSIINIIKNSIDAFIENDITIEKPYIKVKVLSFETHISIEIEDNAGGIDAKILPRVFEPYFSTKSKNGTGLGLYMCKAIISEHLKGDIHMRSEEERTTTTIELPYKIQ